MLVILLLLLLAGVSSRRYHESHVNDEDERYHDMSSSLFKRDKFYNSAERQNDRAYVRHANEIAIDNVVEKNNEIEHRNRKVHRKREKFNSIHVDEIKMPGVDPKEMDTYLCVSHKLPKEERYIVKYEPSAQMQIAHHMLLFACEVPFKHNGTWNCREMKPVCGDGKLSIVYAWAKNAPSLDMPHNVGFRVGGETDFNYLVLQVHYLHVSMFKDGVTDKSGVKFTLDARKKKYLAGIYLMADGWAPIPPHKQKTHIDMGCYYAHGPTIHPFRFRVHAHKLGVVITGYRVRHDKWTLIGRGDPQRPQAFYKVFHHIDIQPGDTLMGRCTYNSTSRNNVTNIGATHADEMCNFYIMYYYNEKQPDEVDELSCAYPQHHFYHHFPKNSDVPLAVMEKSNHVEHSNVIIGQPDHV